MDVNWLQLQLNKRRLTNPESSTRITEGGGNTASKNLVQQTQNNIINNIQRQSINPEQIRMNNLASIDRAVYVKDLLNLPKNMVELLVLVQKNPQIFQPQNKQPTNFQQEQSPNQGQNQGQGQLPNKLVPNFPNHPTTFEQQLNKSNLELPQQQTQQEMLQNKHQQVLQNLNNQLQKNIQNQAQFTPHSQLHQSIINQVRNSSHLQINQPASPTVGSPELQAQTNEQATVLKQQLAQQLDNSVNISHVNALLQQNSKIALNKLIVAMGMATKQGMGDVTPLQETISIISSSISATGQNDATQTLKNLMLLYLPWLPLQDGVGFDLDIESENSAEEKSDTFIKIMIATRNYGNLNATVSLITGNSVDVAIVCSEKFPKKELFKRLLKESNQHSMRTSIDFEEQKPQIQEEIEKPKAKVNLSNVNNVNPYLLLISHAIIRYVIELDSVISIGAQPIQED